MKSFLTKFISHTYIIGVVFKAGIAFGVEPEEIKRSCKISLTQEERRALKDQKFPQTYNDIKFDIIRHLFNRNHLYFPSDTRPETMSLQELNSAIDAIAQKNNSNITTYEFLNTPDNEQNDGRYTPKLKDLDEKIQDSDKQIKALEGNIKSLNEKLKKEKYPLLTHMKGTNDCEKVKDVLETLKIRDFSLMNGSLTTIVPDCLRENWKNSLSDFLLKNNGKDLFFSFCHLEEDLSKEIKNIFLNPLEIHQCFKIGNEITIILQSEALCRGLMYTDTPGSSCANYLEPFRRFAVKLQLIDSCYRISTIFPMPEEVAKTILEPADFVSDDIFPISNIHGLAEYLLSKNKNILIDKDFLFEDIVDSALKHFNTILCCGIPIIEADLAYECKNIFEQSLAREQREIKTEEYKKQIKNQRKEISSLIKSKMQTQPLFVEIWNDVFEPQKILRNACREWYSNSLTTTTLPGYTDPHHLGYICSSNQIYADLLNNVKIVVEYRKTIGTVDKFLIHIVPQNRVDAKFSSGNQGKCWIWCNLNILKGVGIINVSAYPVPESHFTKKFKPLIQHVSKLKLSGKFIDSLSNLKEEDITAGASFDKKNLTDSYPFLLNGELIRNKILASLRGMRYIVYQGETDFVNNKDQQKLKEYQQTLRGIQSIHNLRVQKKEMLQKMQQEKRVRDVQDKIRT